MFFGNKQIEKLNALILQKQVIIVIVLTYAST